MMGDPWGEAPSSASACHPPFSCCNTPLNSLRPPAAIPRPAHLVLHLQPPHHGVQLVHLHLPLVDESGHLKGLRSARGGAR